MLVWWINGWMSKINTPFRNLVAVVSGTEVSSGFLFLHPLCGHRLVSSLVSSLWERWTLAQEALDSHPGLGAQSSLKRPPYWKLPMMAVTSSIFIYVGKVPKLIPKPKTLNSGTWMSRGIYVMPLSHSFVFHGEGLHSFPSPGPRF